MNTFNSQSTLKVGSVEFEYFSLENAEKSGAGEVSKLPFSLKVMLENLLRFEDGQTVSADDIGALVSSLAARRLEKEIAFRPARVLMQDFTGVPAIVDLATMRDVIKQMGGDPKRINPLQQVDLVIDHSVQVDQYGSPTAFAFNADRELERNRERYVFLKWGQKAFQNCRVVPPDVGICHQVNLEYIAKTVFVEHRNGRPRAYPDTLVGTDSHTTMINGLGVVGWGVGGIEAEGAMLGQPLSMLIPQVVGFKLRGRMREGTTATDVVLTVTQMLRAKGVVGKFVEFYGPGLSSLSLADRATIGNMAPEYGATIGLFPIDSETLNYLKLTGREPSHINLVEAYAKAQGLFRTETTTDPIFSDTLELDLTSVEPSLAGPRRPQDRVALKEAKQAFREALPSMAAKQTKNVSSVKVSDNENQYNVGHGSVVIAAITSCTNTSNPSVMLAAGLLAKKAVERGLRVQPWVKTSLAPGSRVVSDYLKETGLMPYLEKLRFHLVGYGCTTCIGNSGPLPEPVASAVKDNGLVVAAVLSGNRNFEGRINPLVRANYLASPPLVVAYALAGKMDIDLETEPLGSDKSGQPVYLRDVWPTQKEVMEAINSSIRAEMFHKAYEESLEGDQRWKMIDAPSGELFQWDPSSTYVKRPPFFENLSRKAPPPNDIRAARALAVLGDSVTTDHISPAGSIAIDSPAGQYLIDHGVAPKDFNSYGARRGNHEVMMRGTFANVRLRNQMAPGTEGGWTVHLPDKTQTTIYEAAMQYRNEGVPLVVLAGKEYGSGSSRDWAAKGPRLLGIEAVIAESFERIHRSNLVGMGVLPLQFRAGENAATLGLTGFETFDIDGIAGGIEPGMLVRIRARAENGEEKSFQAVTRIDTPYEVQYYQHGGILQYVLRQLIDSR
ncbi:MAG: aconitate hydratase 1 [Acidobacteria bacterium 13_1_20CM_2_55_15]|nr:MAG: aconitate hydratase 1 [Acidobacteria bacterium 13_1_40CM_56_16]OLD22269.1 MAG: aconitate hydratase 1 [Acidobacteria bacterium 13_1_40CM_3_56_11]OLE90449.1 MAG: aconitate hydratase 1 [Acidobacteria bacterium 13_1_20CM_2_55_15]